MFKNVKLLKLPTKLIYALGLIVIILYWGNAFLSSFIREDPQEKSYLLTLRKRAMIIDTNQYLRITTLRKSFVNGTANSTTIPIKCDDGSIVVFTGEAAFKVKELRSTAPRRSLDCRSRG